MMELVEELLEKAAEAVRARPGACGEGAGVQRPFKRIEWMPSLNAAAGVDVIALDEQALRELAQRVGVEKPEGLSRPKLLDEMFQALVESKLHGADVRRRLSSRAFAARQAEARKSGADRAVRAVREREGDGECVQRAERSARPASRASRRRPS